MTQTSTDSIRRRHPACGLPMRRRASFPNDTRDSLGPSCHSSDPAFPARQKLCTSTRILRSPQSLLLLSQHEDILHHQVLAMGEFTQPLFGLLAFPTMSSHTLGAPASLSRPPPYHSGGFTNLAGLQTSSRLGAARSLERSFVGSGFSSLCHGMRPMSRLCLQNGTESEGPRAWDESPASPTRAVLQRPDTLGEPPHGMELRLRLPALLKKKARKSLENSEMTPSMHASTHITCHELRMYACR